MTPEHWLPLNAQEKNIPPTALSVLTDLEIEFRAAVIPIKSVEERAAILNSAISVLSRNYVETVKALPAKSHTNSA